MANEHVTVSFFIEPDTDIRATGEGGPWINIGLIPGVTIFPQTAREARRLAIVAAQLADWMEERDAIEAQVDAHNEAQE